MRLRCLLISPGTGQNRDGPPSLGLMSFGNHNFPNSKNNNENFLKELIMFTHFSVIIIVTVWIIGFIFLYSLCSLHCFYFSFFTLFFVFWVCILIPHDSVTCLLYKLPPISGILCCLQICHLQFNFAEVFLWCEVQQDHNINLAQLGFGLCYYLNAQW